MLTVSLIQIILKQVLTEINYFPYDLKKMRSKGIFNSRNDFSLLRETPFGNSFTTNFAIRLIEKEGLGKDDVTDYLSICYSATDNIGHRFGPSSVEMGDAILRLDDEIKNLLTFLNDSIGKKNILIYFTLLMEYQKFRRFWKKTGFLQDILSRIRLCSC